MIIKYEYIGEKVILNIPEGTIYKFFCNSIDEDGFYDYNIYFWSKDTDDIEIIHLNYLMTDYGVDSLYLDILCNRIIDEILHELQTYNPFIDMEKLWERVFERDFEQEWRDKGIISAEYFR